MSRRGPWDTANAKNIKLDTTNFNGILSTAEDDVQAGFDKIDNTLLEIPIVSSGNLVNWNLSVIQAALHEMTENTEIAAPTNMNAGLTTTIRIVQGDGPYTLSWDTIFKWGTESMPVAPAANGDIVIVSFYCNGTNMYGVEMIRDEA